MRVGGSLPYGRGSDKSRARQQAVFRTEANQ